MSRTSNAEVCNVVERHAVETNCRGKTALIIAAERGDSSVVKEILESERDCMQLNAQDIYGETALIKAAKHGHVEIVELLVGHGAKDSVQNNIGYLALHAAITGAFTVAHVGNDFIRCFEKRRKQEQKSFISKIVEILLVRGSSDVNLSDFRGNTPLSLAIQAKPWWWARDTCSILRRHGAADADELENVDPRPPVAVPDDLGRNPLHRFAGASSEFLAETVSTKRKINRILRICKSNPSYRKIFSQMAQARDARRRTALHFAVMKQETDGTAWSTEDVLKCILAIVPSIVNMQDTYGRTALHCAKSDHVRDYLQQHGADKDVKDSYGKTAADLRSLTSEPFLQDKIITKTELKTINDANKIGTLKILKAYYNVVLSNCCRKLLSSSYQGSKLSMRQSVEQLMDCLCKAVARKDARFESYCIMVGSMSEETKTESPDEFDFDFVLTRFSAICRVLSLADEAPGYYHLSRKVPEIDKDFDAYFNERGILVGGKVASRFRFLFLQVLSEADFWKSQTDYEWDFNDQINQTYSKPQLSGPIFETDKDRQDDFKMSNHLGFKIRIIRNTPIGGDHGCVFFPISVDIVPCIRLDEAYDQLQLNLRGETKEFLKKSGCYFVFDRPQRQYPSVPYTEPYVKISFAVAESRAASAWPHALKTAYCAAKMLTRYWDYEGLLDYVYDMYPTPRPSSYLLKTCGMYCLESFAPKQLEILRSVDADGGEVSVRVCLKRLVRCLVQFTRQRMFWSYFMPELVELLRSPNPDRTQFVRDIYEVVFDGEFAVTSSHELEFCRDLLVAELSEIEPSFGAYEGRSLDVAKRKDMEPDSKRKKQE